MLREILSPLSPERIAGALPRHGPDEPGWRGTPSFALGKASAAPVAPVMLILSSLTRQWSAASSPGRRSFRSREARRRIEPFSVATSWGGWKTAVGLGGRGHRQTFRASDERRDEKAFSEVSLPSLSCQATMGKCQTGRMASQSAPEDNGRAVIGSPDAQNTQKTECTSGLGRRDPVMWLPKPVSYQITRPGGGPSREAATAPCADRRSSPPETQ